MKKVLFLVLSLICICGSVLAAPAHKVCVDVKAVSGYDSPDVGGDGWYDDVYKVVAESLSKHGIHSEHSKNVWREFVYYTEKTGVRDKEPRIDAHKLFADFRKDRFDSILVLETTRYVTYKDKGLSDLAITLTVKDPKDIDGTPLYVFKDSKTSMRNVDLFNELKVMSDGLIERYANSK